MGFAPLSFRAACRCAGRGMLPLPSAFRFRHAGEFRADAARRRACFAPDDGFLSAAPCADEPGCAHFLCETYYRALFHIFLLSGDGCKKRSGVEAEGVSRLYRFAETVPFLLPDFALCTADEASGSAVAVAGAFAGNDVCPDLFFPLFLLSAGAAPWWKGLR